MHIDSVRVKAGSAHTFEDLKSGFTFRVAGDGVVERDLTDRLASPQILERADDRRLRMFAAEQIALREKNLAEVETRSEIEKSAARCLGNEWKLDELATRGGQGINCEELVLGDQSVYLNFYERVPTLSLKTEGRQDGWTIQHRIEGPLDGSAWQESAEFHFG